MKLYEKVASTWLHRIVVAAFSPEFYRQIGVQRFRHPETNNHVLFYSLPQEEQKRIHDQWQAKRSPHTTQITRSERDHLKREMTREKRERNEAEAKAGQSDRREMAKALKELKDKNLPKRLYDKEKRRLVQEMESRALVRERERKKQKADAA